MNAEVVARFFHETYEELAPTFGYQTRKESAVPWGSVPENNKNLMIAVSEQVLTRCLSFVRVMERTSTHHAADCELRMHEAEQSEARMRHQLEVERTRSSRYYAKLKELELKVALDAQSRYSDADEKLL